MKGVTPHYSELQNLGLTIRDSLPVQSTNSISHWIKMWISWEIISRETGLSGIFCVIIIMSCRQHGYPWPSLATFPYRSSPPAGLLGYILCPHIAAVCKFGLVILLLLGHMWGSIGVRHLRARPCFSSSVRRVWLIWPV